VQRMCCSLLAVLLVVSTVGLAPSGAAAQGAPIFLPPTSRPVKDPFRPPDGPYGAGNRGIEYATASGDRIVAAASGTVTFAGPVAGSLFVTIEHAPGLRSTYSYLERFFVRTGDRVRRGELLGAAGLGFHLTVRQGDTYLDPADFLGEVRVRVRLVSRSTALRSIRRAVLAL
jgi:murein DD-endopeptidase MepM/ murein hydrolase activator NlpD